MFMLLARVGIRLLCKLGKPSMGQMTSFLAKFRRKPVSKNCYFLIVHTTACISVSVIYFHHSQFFIILVDIWRKLQLYYHFQKIICSCSMASYIITIIIKNLKLISRFPTLNLSNYLFFLLSIRSSDFPPIIFNSFFFIPFWIKDILSILFKLLDKLSMVYDSDIEL